MKRLIAMICIALCGLSAMAQTTVGGTIRSGADQEPLIGATVQIRGTQIGTVSDTEGRYSLSGVASDAVLIFSSLGFEPQEISVDGRTTIDVVLEDELSTINEVVVIGYGVVKRSDLTSSIATVRGEEITEIVSGNAMQALQGKVNGVQVASGGGPGTAPKVLIRGVTTVNGADPLYVVDGMPVGTNINFLNSNDIESMEVLKDASAAAIYGTRASNGVILITTKKGKAGKTTFTIAASVGVQTLAKPDIADAAEYKQVFNATYANDNSTAIWNDKGAETNPGGTDWWDEVINKTAMVQNYSLGIAGGSENLAYNLSVGYYRANSQYDYGYWDKLNARLNTEYTFNPIVKLGFDIAPRVETWDDTPNLFNAAMSMDPTTPVYRPSSEWSDNHYNNYQRSYNNQEWNPAASLERSDAHSSDFGGIINTYLQISPVKQLTLRTQYGVNAHYRRTDKFSPQFRLDALEQTVLNNVSREYQEWLDWTWSNTVNYAETFVDAHNVNAMAGFTMDRNTWHRSYASREDIPSNISQMREIDAGTQNQKSEGTTDSNSLVSFIGRLMYNFSNRYYVTGSLRADGSSRFPEGNQYAFFPSVSASWRVIAEDFMANQTIFQNLKVRGGWGRVGNQNIDNNATLTLLGQADYTFGTSANRASGTMVSGVGNSNLKWETVEDWNVGIDMSVLDSRLDLTFEYFEKKSTDMLYKKQNIFSVGYPDWNCQVWMNIGSMKARGWELGLTWHDSIKDFRYRVGVNLSSIRNEAIRFSGDGPIQTGDFKTDKIIRNEDGGLISRFYGYENIGIFQNIEEIYAHTDEHGNLIQPNAKPGDLRFRDRNHDGILNEDDKTFIGNPYPDLTMGMNLELSYKSFDLSATFYGTFGNDIYNKTKELYSCEKGRNIWAGTYGKTWSETNTSASLPRLSANDANLNYTRVSDFFVEDGSFLRCKQIQLGYTLPKGLLGKADLRLTLSAQNIFTITDYSGMDPERPQLDGSVIETGIDNIAYPNPKTFLFGIDLKF